MSNEPKVGYKNPPKKTQFKKGKSGNPKGRPPKKTTMLGIAKDFLEQEVDGTLNGEKTSISQFEVFILQTYKMACSGHGPSQAILFRLLDKYVFPEELKAFKKQMAKPVPMPEIPDDPEKAMQAYKQLLRDIK